MKNNCIVYYVLHGDSRVRTFPSPEQMERWIRKFHREHGENGDESWIDMTATGLKTLTVNNKCVKLVQFGG